MTTTRHIDPSVLFAEAEAAFQRGDFPAAKAHLANVNRMVPGNAGVLHLSALVARKLNENEAAAAFFAAALSANPRDIQVLNNYANFCRAVEDRTRAVALYDQALAIRPDFTDAAFNRALTLTDMGEFRLARTAFAALEAALKGKANFWSARGRMEREAGDLHRAIACYDTALSIEPAHGRAMHGRALLAMECGEGDAGKRFADIIAQYPADNAAKLGLAQALHEDGDAKGAAMIDALIAEQPTWLDAIRVRAEMRWEAGDADHYLDDINRALTLYPDEADLLRTRINLLAGVDQFAQGADFARDAQRRLPDYREFYQLEAVLAGAAGEQSRAKAAIEALHQRGWRDPANEARHWLQAGDPAQAEALLAELRAAEPDLMDGWALSEFTWRLLGDDRHEWLHGQDGLYALRPLGLTNGDIARIAEYLRGLHNRMAFPVGQSLRGGTQTRGALLWRMEPEARLLREAIFAAVEGHWRGLPAFDAAHPLLKHKDKAPAFRGSWSVRLTDGGFHVSHIHPHGLLSSASYWVMPTAGPNDDAQAGHLEIGRPPKEMRLNLEPRTTIAPLVGHLALFPSTLMHGTRPFSSGERITMAFDVVAH